MDGQDCCHEALKGAFIKMQSENKDALPHFSWMFPGVMSKARPVSTSDPASKRSDNCSTSAVHKESSLKWLHTALVFLSAIIIATCVFVYSLSRFSAGNPLKFNNAGHVVQRRLLSDKPKPLEKKYVMCGMTRVKNDQTYLAQWLEYHRLMGFDKFYIADDCSTDRTWDLLSIYKKENYVSSYRPLTCHRDHKADQALLLNFLFKAARDDCEYLMVFDVDEYITRRNDLYNGGYLKDYVKDKKPMYMHFHTQAMCPAGLVRPDGLMIAAYRRGGREELLLKTMIRSEMPRTWVNPHLPFLTNDFKHLNKEILKTKADPELLTVVHVNGEDLEGFNAPFFINHYFLRSLAEYLTGRAARKAAPSGLPNAWSQHTLDYYNSYAVKLNKTAIAQDFTTSMIPKLNEALKNLEAKYPEFWFAFG